MAELDYDTYVPGYSETVTLKRAVKDEGFQFPIVVRLIETITDYEILNPDQEPELPLGSLLMIESQVNVNYTHVRVLDLEDRTSVIQTKGGQYVSDYDALVNKDFLIPQKLPYKLKISPNPNNLGKKNRYVTVAEVFENMPRYVRVGPGTKCFNPEKQQNKFVQTGLRLEVKKIIRDNDEDLLVCIDDKTKQYTFKHDSLINLTAIDDEHEYTLDQLCPTKMLLPKIVKFVYDISPSDVVVYDDDMASKVLLMTYGSMEVLGTKRRYVLVGYLREKDDTSGAKTYKQVLIPFSLWENVNVKVRSFHSEEEKVHFCKTKFPIYTDESPYQDRLYYIPHESQRTYISYLTTSPSLDSYSDDESSDDYEKPVSTKAPAIPPRTKLTANETKQSQSRASNTTTEENIKLPTKMVNPDVLTRIIERTKLGFGHVHKELAYVFSMKEKPIKITKRQTRYKPSKELHELTRSRQVRPEEETEESKYCGQKNNRNNESKPVAKVKHIHSKATEIKQMDESQDSAKKHKTKDQPNPRYQNTPISNSTVKRPIPIPSMHSKFTEKQPIPVPATHLKYPEKQAHSVPTPHANYTEKQAHSVPTPHPKRTIKQPIPVPTTYSKNTEKQAHSVPTPHPKRTIKQPIPVPTTYSKNPEKQADLVPTVHSKHTEKQPLSDPTVDASTKCKAPPPLPPSPHRPLPEIPVETESDDNKYDYDYPFVFDFIQDAKKTKPIYKQLTAAEVKTVTKKNQTVSDFCLYSVNQVSECFKLCGLDNLSKVCLENTIDGAFLASYEFDLLLKDPFNLSEFQLKKVKRIMQEGWRPKFENS